MESARDASIDDRTQDQSDQEAVDTSLAVTEKIGYGMGDLASNLYWKTFEYFLVYFYTDVFGISAKATGTMLLVTRIWDAINDPLVGSLADRTRTSWGRFRPYLIWMAIPFAITGMLTFYTPDLGPTGKLVYAYITYTLVMMSYTAINVPYGALMGVISPSSLERTSVSTYRFVAAFCGGIIVQYSTLVLVRFFGGMKTIVVDGATRQVVADEQTGFFWTMVVFALTAVLLFFVTFATTRERVQPPLRQDSSWRSDLRFLMRSKKIHQILLAGMVLLTFLATSFSPRALVWIGAAYGILTCLSFTISFVTTRRNQDGGPPSMLELDVNDLLRNRPWMALFGFGLMQLMGAFIRGGAVLYYFKYYCGDATLASAFLVTGSAASIAGMLLTKWLSRRFGKKRLMICVNVVAALTNAAFIFLRPDQVVWMFVLNLVSSFVFGPGPVLLWAMYADATDYSEWRTHRRATGLVFSAATFSQKLGCAIGAAMASFALDLFQYAPPIDGKEQVQSETTLNGLCLMMSLIPASFYLLAVVCLLFYNISESVLRQVETELRDRRRSAVMAGPAE